MLGRKILELCEVPRIRGRRSVWGAILGVLLFDSLLEGFIVRIALLSGFSFEIFAFCFSSVMWVTPCSVPIDNALVRIGYQLFKLIEPILRSLLGSLY
jgi:hypothetical protein